MPKIAVFFPGTGYHCDKPLLYYAREVAKEAGYNEQIKIEYVYDFDSVKDFEELEKTYPILLEQIEKQLGGINWRQYEDILFVSKSMGTVMAATYAEKHNLSEVKHIWLTPVEQAYKMSKGKPIVFIGTKDPVSSFQMIKKLSEEQEMQLFVYDNCNHSLECGDTQKDLTVLANVMSRILAAISDIA